MGCQLLQVLLQLHFFFFADDSFIFMRASLEECEQVNRVLEVYEKASGQCVSFDKSSICFSRM